jgi:Putative DNA-binding domain
MNPTPWPAAHCNEALRQQMLLRALWGDARPGVVAGWLRGAPQRGLQAYRANAGALAERALAAAYPTVAQLVGDESFAALARAFWAAAAPERGDIALWGEALSGFVAAAPQLANEPYLADVARLDWAVHVAEQAADGPTAPAGLEMLGAADPAAICLRLAHGMALLRSPHPIASIWQAHRSHAADRFDPVRAAFARGGGESALVWRDGFRPAVSALSAPAARFTASVIDGHTLAHALEQAGAEFSFGSWLQQALQQRWLRAVEHPASIPSPVSS